MTNNKINYIIGASVLFLTACKVPQVIQKTALNEVPAAFENTVTDTVAIPMLSPADFFADPQLLKYLEIALRDNWDYKIVMQRMDIAMAHLSTAKAQFLPSVNGLLNASGTRFGKYTMEGVGNFDTNLSNNIEEEQKVKTNPTPNYFLGLGTNWEIDIWGKLKQKKKAAQQRFLASVEGRKWLESTLVSHVAATYYDLVVCDQEISILEQNIRLQEAALDVVKIQFEVGRATRLAVSQMEAQYNHSQALLNSQKIVLAETEAAFLALLGKYEMPIERPKVIDMNAVRYLSGAAIPTQVMQNRPDIQQAFLELEATHADAKAARAAFFPTVNISAYGAFNAFSGEMLFNTSSFAWQLFGGLTAPIFNKKQIKNDFKIAKANQEIAFYEFQKVAQGAYLEVNTLLKQLAHNNQVYNWKQKELNALNEGVELSNDLYVSGYATYLELVAAQKSKLEADLQIIDIKRQQVYQYIRLYKALGGGFSI